MDFFINEFGGLSGGFLVSLGLLLIVAEIFIVSTFFTVFIGASMIAVGFYAEFYPETLGWKGQLAVIAISSAALTFAFKDGLFRKKNDKDVSDEYAFEQSDGVGTFSKGAEGEAPMIQFRGTFWAIHPDSDSVEALDDKAQVKIQIVEHKALYQTNPKAD